MDTLIIVAITVVAVAVIVLYWARRRAKVASAVGDARSQARRWVERLGGQVYTLDPKDDAAARQALADAAERFTAAGAQIDQSTTHGAVPARWADRPRGPVLHTGSAGIAWIGPWAGTARAPRSGTGRRRHRRPVGPCRGPRVPVSPTPSDRTRHYYPGGTVAGRPVQRGWYSDPWWQSAIDTGTWALSSYLIASSLFYGTAGYGWETGHAAGLQSAAGVDGGHDADHANAASGDTVSPGDFDGGDY